MSDAPRFVGMNGFRGKALLSRLRSADFAHAGEYEAIDLALSHLPSPIGGAALDAGCGRGATAHYLKQRGFQEVRGIDSDADSIRYAQQTYPEVSFSTSDLTARDAGLAERFDFAFMFNVLYAIPDRTAALRNLHDYCKPGATLTIFDYVALDAPRLHEKRPLSNTPPTPETLQQELAQAGWRLAHSQNLDEEYRTWYRALLKKFDELQTVDESEAEYVQSAQKKFQTLLQCLEQNLLGGTLLQAKK